MKPNVLIALTLLTLLFSVSAASSEQPDHFEGLMPKNLEEAVANFSLYNAKLSEIVRNNELSPENMHTVHEMTYTLENAMARISSELDALAEDLEAVHIASEKADVDTVQSQGIRYIESAKKIIP